MNQHPTSIFKIRSRYVERFKMNDWGKVVSFHGHPCCLLAVGYRATKVALEQPGVVEMRWKHASGLVMMDGLSVQSYENALDE